MNPRIDKIMMSNSGHQATVSGPINWESDDTSATFSTAVVQMAQGGQTVLAAGQNARVFTPADQRWETVVHTLNGNQLVAGAADGWAAAAVLETLGSYECYPWQVENIEVIDDVVRVQ